MNRRRALTLIGAVGLTGAAGCLGEDGKIGGTASPAEIPEEARPAYEADGPRAIEINETVEVGGLSRDVEITTWSAGYASTENEASVFLVSTPDITVAGQSLNPLARLSGADLITRVVDQGLGRAGGDMSLKEIEQEDEVELTVLDETRTLPIFSATLEVDGGESADGIAGAENGEIKIRLYLLSITHGEDVLLAVGIHPAEVEASEDIQSMMAAIEHPVDEGEFNEPIETQ